MADQWLVVMPKWANGTPIMGQVRFSTGSGFVRTVNVDKSGKAWCKKQGEIAEGKTVNVVVLKIVDVYDPVNIVDDSDVTLDAPVNNSWLYEVIVGAPGGEVESWAILQVVGSDGKAIPGIKVNVEPGYQEFVQGAFAITDGNGKAWFNRTGAIELQWTYPGTPPNRTYRQRIEYYKTPVTVVFEVLSVDEVQEALEERLRLEEEERQRQAAEQQKILDEREKKKEEEKKKKESKGDGDEDGDDGDDGGDGGDGGKKNKKKYNWVIVVLLLIMFTLIFRSLATPGSD